MLHVLVMAGRLRSSEQKDDTIGLMAQVERFAMLQFELLERIMIIMGLYPPDIRAAGTACKL